jgi:uncharacterized protein
LPEVIDAHVNVKVPGIQSLFPFLAGRWQEFIRNAAFTAAGGYDWSYPPGAPTTLRPDPSGTGGSAVITDLSGLQSKVLEPMGLSGAVIACYYGVDMIRHPDFGCALASAVNDWLVEEWLNQDDRVRASMIVGHFDVPAAVKEIDRLGSHPGFVQVLLPVRSERPYGNRYWHPLFEAIERNNLVAGIHFGGMQGNPPTPTGWPTYYLEEYVGMPTVFQSQITSIVVEGLLEIFPRLRIALLGAGFSWLPTLMWRLDKEWKGLRREVPWLRRAPTSYIFGNMRSSTEPLDMPPDPRHMTQILDWIGSDDFLMFASGYPHRHEGSVDELLVLLGTEQRQKLMAGTARGFYAFG